MSVTNLLVGCPNIQDLLENNFQTCAAAGMREANPHLTYVSSPANNMGIQQKVVKGNGQLATVELTYLQRLTLGEVQTNVTNPSCVAVTKRGNESQNYEMDSTDNVGVEQLFNISDWIAICEKPEDSYVKQIQRLIDGVIRRIAQKTAEQALLLEGGWNSTVLNVNGSDELEIATLITTASGNIAPFGMQKINMAKMKSLYCAPTALFAGEDLYNYYGQMLAGCCANMGVDLGRIMAQFGQGVAWDPYITAAFASEDKGLLTQLGSMTLLKYTVNSVYDGANLLERGLNSYHTVIVDPETQIPLDLNIKNDCGAISVQVVGATKLVAVPTDIYQAADPNGGVNYSAVIKVVNPA